MKKVFCILSIFTMTSPALALTDANRNNVATAGYVAGAVNAVTSEYNATTNPAGRIVISGSGENVSNISVSNGKITYTKTNEVTIPVDALNSASRANIWVE